MCPGPWQATHPPCLNAVPLSERILPVRAADGLLGLAREGPLCGPCRRLPSAVREWALFFFAWPSVSASLSLSPCRLLLNLEARYIVVRLLVVRQQIKKSVRCLLAPGLSKELLLVPW